jgi:hypothetical protein
LSEQLLLTVVAALVQLTLLDQFLGLVVFHLRFQFLQLHKVHEAAEALRVAEQPRQQLPLVGGGLVIVVTVQNVVVLSVAEVRHDVQVLDLVLDVLQVLQAVT